MVVSIVIRLPQSSSILVKFYSNATNIIQIALELDRIGRFWLLMVPIFINHPLLGTFHGNSPLDSCRPQRLHRTEVALRDLGPDVFLLVMKELCQKWLEIGSSPQS